MKTLQDIEQFYQTQLSADLAVLEEKRRKILQKIIFIALAVPAVVILSFFFLLRDAHMVISPITIFVPLIFSIAIIAPIAYFITREYRSEFKLLVIDKIVRFLDPGLNYDHNDYIPKSTFMLSQIFKTTPNIYKGDDYVCGKIDKTQIEFSELNALYESGSGKHRTVTTVFKGLFFIADFNKDFSCQTVVLPDAAEKLFGHFGQKLQSMNFTRDQLIKLDDPEFENLFVVYSNDQIEARYILSPALMKRIVDFKKKSARNIHLSFVGSKVFVAISYTRSLFEPRLFNTLLNFEPVREYFEDLQLAVGIAEDLNLNTRIWSKQ